MNRGEAIETSILAQYLLQYGVLGSPVPSADRARDALVALLGRAEKTQQMRLAPDDLPQRWEDLVARLRPAMSDVADRAAERRARREAAARLRKAAVGLDHDPGLLVLADLMGDLAGPGGGYLLTGGWVGVENLAAAARALLAPSDVAAEESR